MFDELRSQKQSFWPSFWGQQLLVPLCCVFIGSVVSKNLEQAVLPIVQLSSLIHVVGPTATAFALGFRLQASWDSAYETARWIWVAPACVGIVFATLVLLKHGTGLAFVYLFDVGPTAPELGLGPYLVTYPALASGFYVLGAAAQRRKKRRRRESS